MASFSTPHFQLTSTQTALAFLVPEVLQPEINSLRKIHDKAFSKWQPHINVLYPFVEPPRLTSAVAILRETLQSKHVKRIKLDTNGVGVFKHRRNATVFLKPSSESEDSICQLRRILVHALGCDERDGTYDGTFRPHLSVGQAGLNGTSVDKLVEQAEKIVRLDWKATCLVVLKREVSGGMGVVEELRLGSLEDEGHQRFEKVSLDTEWKSCYSCTKDEGWKQYIEGPNTLPPEQPTPLKVQILTYNLMAEPSAPPFQSRLPLIVEAIESITAPIPRLRILCLQEISDEILPLLLADSFIQRNFPFSTHMPSSLLPSRRNLVTLSSEPFRQFCLQFPERHKTALVTSLSYFPLEVANVHLTSALTDHAVEAKKGQMEALTNFLAQDRRASKVIFVAGDFNLTTSSRTLETALSRKIITPETVRLVGTVINPDAWQDTFNLSEQIRDNHLDGLFDGEQGPTFDRLTNHLAAMSDSPIENRPERYDRVLVRKGERVYPEQFEFFGLPTDHGLCGSDHYGVSVTLRIGDAADTPVGSEAIVSDHPERSLDAIQVVEDSADIYPLLEPYLPTQADRDQRHQALTLLQETLNSSKNTSNIILATLGSYLMETYFPESDVDLLAIGSIRPQVFFDFATTQLRLLDTYGGNRFKGVHFVNSLVSIVEVSVLGVKFDLQYCQAPELLGRYHSTTNSDLSTLVFDRALVSSLSPSAIRPLNTFRDTAYLLHSIPDLPSYRTAHRYLSLYLKRRGLYSAKFGYLGGIHLSLMLSRVMKLIATNTASGNQSNSDSGAKISPGTMIRTFFTYYSAFNWAEDNITDPSLSSHKNVARSPRDSVFIYSIHTPTARRNVASSCTRLTAQTLTKEFKIAAEKLRLGDWKWCIRPQEAGIRDFLNGFGAFIRVQVDVWDVDEASGDKVREVMGSLESKFPRVLVSLGRVSGLDGRVWPLRFRVSESESESEWKEPEMNKAVEKEFKGYYLVGVSARDENLDPQGKKLLTGKAIAAMREFETSVKESREFQCGNVWVSMELVPKKKILDMDLVADERDWGILQELSILEPTNSGLAQSNLDCSLAPVGSSADSKLPQRSQKLPLRPAQDIMSRIHWDSAHSVDDFVIGYEDRFVGVKEIELARWKNEQTDDEFIPMHRIVWVRRKGPGGGEKVWDRKEKLDTIFGSGTIKNKRRSS